MELAIVARNPDLAYAMVGVPSAVEVLATAPMEAKMLLAAPRAPCPIPPSGC